MKPVQQKNVHYFPGHMKKALGNLAPFIKGCDLVIEIADARAPISSRNPLIDELIGEKPRILILSKDDYADPVSTQQWVRYFSSLNLPCFAGTLTSRTIHSRLIEISRPIALKKAEKEKRIGMKPQPLRLAVLGIPNVGKSTFINTLAGKNAAKSGNKPGVTRAEQWIKIKDGFVLLDTPGILPMNYPDGVMAVRLALLGSIKEEVLPNHELALALLGYLRENYPSSFFPRFGIADLSSLDSDDVIGEVARSRGMLLKGSKLDEEKAVSLILREFRDGFLGRFSLEKVDA